MTWLNSLKSLVTRKVQPATYAEPTFFKRGNWVTCPDGVAIVLDTSSSGSIGVALIAEDGTTIANMSVPASSVILAKFDQIPESRRFFSREYAAQLGYN